MPTVQQAEAVIAALEGAEERDAVRLRHGGGDRGVPGADRPTHIVASQVMYWAFRAWLARPGRFGHTRDLRRDRRPRRRRARRCGRARPGWSGSRRPAIRCGPSPTSPPSPRSRTRPARCCAVDSTVATPVFTRPLALGADIVMHSATEIPQRPFRRDRRRAGDRARRRAVGAHQDGAHRSTAPSSGRSRPGCCCAACARCDVRVRTAVGHRRTARGTARRTSGASQRALSRPAVASRPRDRRAADERRLRRHAVDPRQGRRAAAIATAARVELWKRATSLGGVESLIEHRASIEGAGHALPARPAAALGRARGRRRPVRRSGARHSGRRAATDPSAGARPAGGLASAADPSAQPTNGPTGRSIAAADLPHVERSSAARRRAGARRAAGSGEVNTA